MDEMKLILASGSPRRRELLERAGYVFEVVISNADESAAEDCEPSSLAQGNALIKAAAVSKQVGDGALVIGADTIVTLDGHVFGKPADATTAHDILTTLSGRTHQVITGVALVCGDAYLSFTESTDVVFKQLDEQTIADYIATGDPFDKAGAYGIQSKGGHLVDHIEGNYDNVVGLPMEHLARMLSKLGVEPTR